VPRVRFQPHLMRGVRHHKQNRGNQEHAFAAVQPCRRTP
jgi:hypothetical protein